MSKTAYVGSNGAVTFNSAGFAFVRRVRAYRTSIQGGDIEGHFCSALGGWLEQMGFTQFGDTLYANSGNYWSQGSIGADGHITDYGYVVGSIGTATYYTITTSPGTGGSMSGGGDFKSGDSCTIKATPNSGYVVDVLNGVSQDLKTGAKSTTITVAGDATITATFRPYYTLTFSANGGSGAPSSKSPCFANVAYEIPTTVPTRTGHLFMGWAISTTNAGNGVVSYQPGDNYSRSSVTAGQSVTLYAVWKQYTLTYDANGGSTTPSQQTYYGNVTLAAAISFTGRTFLGWKIGSTIYSAGATYNLTADATAVAQWTNISFRNDNTSVGSISLFDVSLNEKVADEVDGYIKYSGVKNHIYRVDVNVSNFLYEGRGVYVNGSYIEPYQFTFSNDDVTGVYYFTEKPLYSFGFTSTHGSVSVSPAADSDGKYARGRVISMSITPDAGYEARQATFVNIDTNDVVNKSVVDNAVSLDGITFNTMAVIDYAQIDYDLSAAKHTASASAISSVSVTVGGNAAETAHYGDTAVFTATVASGFLFAGWYDGSGNLVSEDAEYSATVSGAISLYAKAKVAAALSIAYDDEGAESCTITVDGEAYTWGDTLYVVLGDSFAYALTLGDRVTGTPWQFDCWKSGGTALAYGQSGEVAPNAAFSMTAHVAALVSRAIEVVAVRMGETSAAAADADDLTNAITCYGEASAATDESGGSGATDPFRFVFSQTQIVHVTASANVTFTGDSAAKSFYCFSTTDPSTLDGTATPPEESVISFEAETAFLLNTSEKRIYAYYGTPVAVVTTLGYAALSDSTMGSIAVVAVDEEDTAAEIASDGRSATATQGKNITIRATPANGYRFAGWHLAQSAAGDPAYSNAEESIRVTTQRTIYAKFVKDTHSVCEWEGDPTPKAMTWRSKTYESSKPFNPSACRVDALGYNGDGKGTLLELTVDMFSAPDAAATASTKLNNIASQNARRLPVRRMERYMQIEVKANTEVDALLVGTSMGGLAQ